MRRTPSLSILIGAAILVLGPAIAGFADAPPAIADFVAKGFPDNGDLRGKLFSYVIGASRDLALKYGEKRLQSAAAGQVTVRVEQRSADFIVEFVNASEAGLDRPGRGSCYIQRSNAKGNYILQARILLEDDPSCYLALSPSGSGTRGDVVMYGAVVKKGLFFSDMIYRILLLSFSDIVDATSRSFDWGQVFRFGGGEASAAYLAGLRSFQPELAEAEPSAPSSTSAPIALGTLSPDKVSLAAAPSMPAPAAADSAPKAPRPARLAAELERAASIEAFLQGLAASGETDARELALDPGAAAAFLDDRGEIGKITYPEYPRYDARGLPFQALRSAIYLDFLANPDSVYSIAGEGIRATIVPSFDDAGRLSFSFFAGGKETSWDELSAGKRDLRVRVVRSGA